MGVIYCMMSQTVSMVQAAEAGLGTSLMKRLQQSVTEQCCYHGTVNAWWVEH